MNDIKLLTNNHSAWIPVQQNKLCEMQFKYSLNALF